MKIAITGSSGGIGRASALYFARREPSANLVLLSRLSAQQEETEKQLTELGAQFTSLECDLASRESVDRATSEILSGPEACDVIIHNAGIIERAAIKDFKDDSWDLQMEVNLTSPIRLTRALLPAMLKQGRGRILFVSSISAVLGSKNQAAYHASKAGLLGAMRCLAEELSDTGLMTLALLPGAVDTRMLEGSPYPARMSPQDVAKTLGFYALDAPLAHNGASIEMFGV